MRLATIERWLLRFGRGLPSGIRRRILTLGGRRLYFHPWALLSQYVSGNLAWEPFRTGSSILTPVHRKPRGTGRYLDLRVALRLDWSQTRVYEHGTIGLEYGDGPALGGLVILTFRQDQLDRFETVRVRLPDEVVNASYIRVRVLPAPHCLDGRYKIGWINLVKDSTRDARLTRIADLEDLKSRTRVLAAEAEAQKAEICDHMPVALTFELTAACNLTCSHCFSHGEPDLHRFHNKLASISIEQLEALARDVFPSLTVISVVGRGEPLILKQDVWKRLLELAADYRVKLAITTNGYFLEKRLTPDVLPLIDNINVSMDGLSPEVFAANRGGADIDRVWKNVAFYDSLRRAASLARAPRLSFAYTLKRNNVAELSGFVRKIATFDADMLTTRHMISLFDSSKDQTLLLMPPAEANTHLRAAYDLLEGFGIRRDCVPLFAEPAPQPAIADQPIAPEPAPEIQTSEELEPAPMHAEELPSEPCIFIHRMPVIMAGGEVMVCAVPHAEKAGHLGAETRFEDIWNGEKLKSVRSRLNTDNEWPQCRHCSYREGRVSTQQKLAAENKCYDSSQQGQFSDEALNFRDRQPEA